MIFYIFNPHHCKIACCARYESVQEVRILPNNGICTFATQLFSLYFVALLQNRLYSPKTSLRKKTGWVIYFLGGGILVGDIFLGVGDIIFLGGWGIYLLVGGSYISWGWVIYRQPLLLLWKNEINPAS